MRAEDLLAGLDHRWALGAGGIEISGVTHDSRQAGPGVVFVAIPGTKADGLDFATDASSRGAEAIVVGRGRAGSRQLERARRVIEVEDERIALAVMARNLYGKADEAVRVVGVTGTNGKTTTCRILASILEADGISVGLIGTVGHRVGATELAADRTTPEAPDLHRLLAAMRDEGCSDCVMEVSSHALELRRVHGIRFEVAVFTNLTRDHLDFHRDMETYFRAKARLFEEPGPATASIVNADDPHGANLAKRIAGRVMTYGASADSSLWMSSIETSPSGCRVTLREAGATPIALEAGLPGRPNAYNIAAAAGAARVLGVGWKEIAAGVASVGAVPGRLERVTVEARADRRQDFAVIVDYAHTDDALKSLLETVREFTSRRVIVVFGCGGDRDRSKRPLMGAHASRLADLVYVTSDNPRTERPDSILEEILGGVDPEWREKVRVDPDRRAAIAAAITAARSGDTVVIAGKGHETYQIIGDRVTSFDDRVVAREALERALAGGGPATSG